MNTPGSFGDFEWYQSRSIHRRNQVEWWYALQSEDFSNNSSIGEIDGVKWLDPDTHITRGLGRYRERGIISHGVEDDNDITDRVVKMRNRSLLVIGVGDHIGRIDVVEHALIGCEQDSDGSDGWVPILVRIHPGECAVTGWALDEHGVVHFPLITKRHIFALNMASISS